MKRFVYLLIVLIAAACAASADTLPTGTRETHSLLETAGATAGAVLTFFGGGVAATAVLGFFANFFVNRVIESKKASLNQELERLKAELSKETETHKLRLKKQELIFNKELEAAGDFMKLHREILPTYSHPDMDWDDACGEVAQRLSKIETDLDSFLVRHGAVIRTSARKLLSECRSLASNYKFGCIEEAQLFHEAKTKAGELLEKLSKIEEDLIEAVQS